MKILINYGDEKFKKAQAWNTWTGKHIARFDKIYSFGPEDVDTEYREAHRDVLDIPRGNGLWLWKSYFINKVMQEADEGDYVCYFDSGAFFIRSIDTIINSMRKDEKIWVSDCPLLEACFTKQECFEAMQCDKEKYKRTNQIQGGFFLAICCKETKNFVREWQAWSEKYEVISPLGGLDINEYRGEQFVAHREDQSILSLLCKKKGIKAHRDPSQRGKYPETFYNEKYAYIVPEHLDDKYKPLVFLHKLTSVSIWRCIKIMLQTYRTKNRVSKIIRQ